MNRTVGIVLIVIGAILIGIGGLAYAGLLGWLGRLPGDIRIESGQTRIFIPITSMIVVSVALSLLLHLIRKLFG